MQVTKPLQAYFNTKALYVFVAICSIYALSLIVEFKYIFTDEFYKQALENKSNSPDKISQFIIKDRQTEWVNYPFIFIVVLVPTIAITSVLFLGSILKEYKVSFKSIFSIVLKAQIVFAINYLLAVVLRSLGLIKYDFGNVNNNYEFESVFAFFKVEKIQYLLHYPLQFLNITEFVHIMVLSFGMAQILEMKYLSSLKYVSLYYGFSLLFWIVFITFIETIY
jgi:hypothetical protein